MLLEIIFDRGDYRLVETKAYTDKSLPTLAGNVYCQYLGKPAIVRQNTVSVLDDGALKSGNSLVQKKKPLFARLKDKETIL